MKYLTVQNIQNMLIGAYHNVKKHKDEINKINMFPVPDQDTGSNLDQTLKGIYDAINKKKFPKMRNLIKAVLDSSLNSASGNVGIIYTGFLSGFFSETKNEKWNHYDLLKAFQNGAEQARLSIQNPKQGTILDVFDAVFDVKTITNDNDNINELLSLITYYAKRALFETRNKMKIYKDASVVDAGGFGFFLTLEGFKRGLEQGSNFDDMSPDTNKKRKKIFIQILKNRYEVVALLRQIRFSRSEMIAKLSNWGESLDIVEANGKMKIHIHTDDPIEVINHIEMSGTVIQMNTQDMTKAVGEEKERDESIGIIVDSGADLSRDIAKENNIEIVDFNVVLEENNDKTELNSLAPIYQIMRKARQQKKNISIKTSQPSPGKFLTSFKKQLHRFQSIVCITFSSALSGSYNSALQAKNQLSENEKERVYIVDSLSASGAQALFALKTQELIQRGEVIDTIINELSLLKKRNKVFGIPEDASWLEAGGRITHFQATFLRLLKKIGLRPVLGIKNNKLGLVGFRFVFERISQALYFEFLHQIRKMEKSKNIVQVYITYSEIRDEANALKKLIEKNGYRVKSVEENSSVIGAHVGPGVLFCSFIC